MRRCATVLVLLLGGCSADAPRTESRPAATPLPADESRWFPAKDQVSTRVVAHHLLGPSLAPGGTLGEYRNARQAYQLGLIHMASSDKAAFFLLDVRKAVANPQYLAHMGGYYGLQDGAPLYVFAKGPYVASVSGLAMKEADPIARTFAARIP